MVPDGVRVLLAFDEGWVFLLLFYVPRANPVKMPVRTAAPRLLEPAFAQGRKAQG